MYVCPQYTSERRVLLWPSLSDKNVFLDPDVLRRVQEILDTQSESEAIREALNPVIFRQEVIQGFDKVAGNIPDFWDRWEEQ